ncbi:hypothetical protein D1BOALGB6SA_2181 [Olavius sp. associated proteobacterium Delta 1]|nr:hypothetical protein D1BOALGB6SA_2181 [Olavius sp. associated proteobacterium Delta 1]
MPKTLRINIADAGIGIEDDAAANSWEVAPAYRPFVRSGPADIRLRLHQGSPAPPAGEAVFDCPPIWTLYRQNTTSIIKMFSGYPDQERTLVLPPDLANTDLYFSDRAGCFQDPFYGPTMELLMINYLARERGGILHACGIEYNGMGLLFAGESGAGKSTLANQWQREDRATVLSDDRTIVRDVAGEIRMYGTPWHGEAKFGSPRGCRLETIFFLRHSQKNAIQPQSTAESVLQLLQCSFPPYWDAAGMEYTMKFFESLATRISCHELSFRPDDSVIEMIKRYKV